jgi:trehalose 6-phosphate phosphatase
VISGRPLPELKKLVPVAGVRLLGLHGWSGSKQLSLATDRSIFQNAKQLIEQQLPRCPGLWLQDKGLGLAIHFRGATASALRSGRQVVIGVLESFKPQLHLLEGKGIWELLPHQIDGKGPAVHALLAKSSNPVLPIFVGDDTSDESAFAVVRGGLSIHVGRGHRTKARFRLRNPAEVAQFLKRLEAMRSCR